MLSLRTHSLVAPQQQEVRGRQRQLRRDHDLAAVPAQHTEVDLHAGFGRTVVSEIEAPNMFSERLV